MAGEIVQPINRSCCFNVRKFMRQVHTSFHRPANEQLISKWMFA